MPNLPAGLDLDALTQTIRSSAGADTWRHGSRLANDPRVAVEAADDDEIEIRVPREKGILSWSVSLYPADDEWCCDCPSKRNTCEHVCAAVVVAARSAQGIRTEPAGNLVVGSLHYAFVRDDTTLRLQRFIQRGNERTPLRSSLGRCAKDPDFVATVVVQERDLDIELVLNKSINERLSRERLPELFKALQGVKNVSLDGRAVTINASPVHPSLQVERTQGGFIARLKRADSVDEIFENGIARCGDSLRPLGDGGMSQAETRLYSRGRYYPEHEVTRLMTEDLAHISPSVEVEWSEGSPPELETHPLHVRFVATHEDGTLSIRGELIYGQLDNPVGRVVDHELEILGDVIPLRDFDEEERLREMLRSELGLLPGIEASLRDQEAVHFSKKLERFDAHIDEALLDYFRPVSPLSAALDLEDNNFSLRFRSGASIVPNDRVLRAWSNGDTYVPLTDGGLAPLPREWLAKCGGILLDLLDAKSLDGRLPRTSLPDLGRLCEALDLEMPSGVRGLEEWIESLSEQEAAGLPADLQAELRDYQRDAVNWLVALREQQFGALLADDMGLGKTLQAITAINGKTLVVAPTSVLTNWEKEIHRFRPSLRVARYHGANRGVSAEVDVVVTTYALLRLDVETLRAVEWDIVILDEAQAIKNPSSKVAQAAYSLRANFRLALTGTPVENRLEELWSQFRFLNPGLLGTLHRFKTRYSIPMERGDEAVASHLRTRIKPFVLRRLKRDVARELPPRTDSVLHVELSEEERAVYDAVRLGAQDDVRRLLAAGGSTMKALEALLRLRQASCHTGLIPGQNAESSSKVLLLGETLEQVVEEGHKALVFSQWTSLLDRIQTDLQKRCLDYVRLDGSTRDRGGVVDSFQDLSGPPVMLLSLKAGGTGLNLTAADHVFIVDPWWNPAVEDQAADRAHRIGQERPVIVHRLIAKRTVEEKILELQERKRLLADHALTGANHGGRITHEDLLALLAP